jgi:anti-anti-sigma factor
MPKAGLNSETRIFDVQLLGPTIVLTPLGNLNELEYSQIDKAAAQMLRLLSQDQSRNIVLDFHRTDYYGSTALGFFLKLWKRVKMRHGHMAFCNVSPHELEILRITRLDKFWPICSSRAEALRVISQEDG